MSLVTGGTGLEPFSLPTRTGGVGHQLIIGPTGSGKSSLLGAMVCNYSGIPRSRIIWLDVDYSSFVLAHLLGADYRDVGAPDSPPLNPMAFLDIEGGLEYLSGWFERVFKRWNLELSERDFEDFTDALSKARREGVRNLAGLRALVYGGGDGRSRIRRILSHYIQYWGHIFNASDSERRNLADSQVTVYEIRALMGHGLRCSAPAIELILQNVIFALDGSPTWIFIDEAWQLLSDETSAEWLFAAIRMFRRKNTAVVLSTQSLTEIVHSPYRALLLESLPGKIFLPNPEAMGRHVASMYLELGLNEHEIAIISRASPRRQYYYRSSAGARLFTLALGRVAARICASTSYADVQSARELLRQYPNEPFLPLWIRTGAQGLSGVTTSALA